jgi:hypothetical protein
MMELDDALIVVLFLAIMLLVTSCTFLPAPLAYLNYARTGYDVTQIVSDEPTLTDAAISLTTGMDCKLFNALYGENICAGRPKRR